MIFGWQQALLLLVYKNVTMKKFLFLICMATAIVSLSGCLSTLYPLFTEKDLVFESGLLGSWNAPSDSSIMIFEKSTLQDFKDRPSLQPLANKSYIVTLKEHIADLEGTKGHLDDQFIETRFIACLTRLGNGLYLDLYPHETSRQKQYNNFYKQHYIGLHSLYRIQLKNDHSFDMGQLKEEYLKNLIDKKQVRIPYEISYNGSYIITATTEQLQQYVLKYGQVPEAYEHNTHYKKIPHL